MTRTVALLALAVVAAAPAAAGAQRSVMRGKVVSADSAHRPVEGAEVAIPSLQRVARTGADGEYVLDALPGGAHVVTVRRLGFVPVQRGVIMSGEADDTAAVTFALAPRVAELTAVMVRDDAAEPRAMERERARSNGGAFIGRATLAQNDHAPMSNILRRVPGISLVRYPTNGRTYYALGSSRGTTRMMGQPGRPRSPYCFYQLYVDGVQRYAPSDDPGAQPPPDVDELKPSEYEAIEIYRGGAQVPQQYAGTGAACGTVLLWSRTR
jgi:hypothetical protein